MRVANARGERESQRGALHNTGTVAGTMLLSHTVAWRRQAAVTIHGSDSRCPTLRFPGRHPRPGDPPVRRKSPRP
eukprot:369808-Prymnesium_polylepis.1